ncbi:tetratricopeptide repeat protein [Marivita sp. GX14005]|uniref:tetratricopeptide repeat protein n=1 Tax=Marivita sp. GX14005 TaxID=2942276 RepID=UPI002019E71A|nr:tetratricopeptide repeat protein [Marivita sp. GX14005]MCL3881370.1 tetratricopeptide repeat protein [Marivita sp. GX14005]
MIELGQGTDGADLIKDVSQDAFMAEVVEGSMNGPVIVDFWAPWCGPCKTLGPQLEAAVRSARGAVRMVKVNVDEAQELVQALAQQGLPIQSIPTVIAFVQGRPIDMFQGAKSPSELKAFVDKVIATSGGQTGNGLDDAVAAAEEMLESGAAVDAMQTFSAVLEEEPHHARAYAGLVQANLAIGEVEQAEAILNGAPAEISDSAEIEAAHAQVELAKQAKEAGPIDELQAKVEANGDDHQARFDLARALYASGDAQGAVDQLLELFRRDREWNDGAAKSQLMTIFDALKPNDPVALNGRRRLSSMIFA